MKLKTLSDLLLHELKDLYDAEHRILKALPKMAKAASSMRLKRAFEYHLSQTKDHIKRLERCFSLLKKKAARQTCDGMKGLLSEGEKGMKEAKPPVLNAALISAAQRVEHYEIAAYGCARTYANTLGYGAVADLLQQTLDEEMETDETLTKIAEEEANPDARR